jgi:nucleotide-binding universal stress UspA family protein/RimJ/RimL family protein N-acetyltransferase
MADEPSSETTLRLDDGARVHVRPIRPVDRDAVAAGFERLSPESRYRRFFSAVPELTSRELDYLTQVDHHDHEALVAVDEEGEGVAVARFVRVGDDVAEPAIVVADDWQQRGLARMLLDALAQRAREEGVHRFRAPVLATNDAAIRVLSGLGDTTRTSLGREVELTVALPEDEGAGRALVELLRAVAAGTVRPARTLLARLGPAPRPAPVPLRELTNAILVGTDGSPEASLAVDRAAGLAEVWGSTVHLMAAHRPLLDDGTEAGEHLAATASYLAERGLDVRTHVRRGDPAASLVDIAAHEQVALVVVGATARSGATRRVLGSVSDSVAQRAPCNVLIVRDGEPVGRDESG